MTPIGKRIASRLAELKKSQHWLADEVGIKQPSINALMKSGQGSKHTVAIAEALGVSPKWLVDGSGPKFLAKKPEALIVGYVGAGAEVHRFEQGDVLESVDLELGIENCNAARVSGDSMDPLRDGWLIFYGEEHRGIPEECVGRLCVVGVKDGPTLLKTLKRGSRKGLFRLESWSGPERDNVAIAWAARVIDIRPT